MSSTPQPIRVAIGASATDLYTAFVGSGAARGQLVSLNFSNTTAAAITVDVWFRNAGDTTSTYLVKVLSVLANSTKEWRGLVVFNTAGEKLRAQASATGVDCLGSVIENISVAGGGGGVTDHGALTGLGDDDHTQYQKESERNAASGYAGLDGSTKLTGAQQVYGAVANTAAEGNDARLSDARTPVAHKTTHEPGGGDPMAVDAAAATGSLRTVGTGALQACAGNDGRLSDARTPTAHATSHKNSGSDEVATATPAANAIPKAGTGGKLDTWISDAAAAVKGLVQLAGQLGGSAASPDVRGLRETAGPTLLALGAVADGQFLKRTGATVVGAAGGGGVTDHGDLTGLADDDHPQYTTDAEADAIADGLIASHAGLPNVHHTRKHGLGASDDHDNLADYSVALKLNSAYFGDANFQARIGASNPGIVFDQDYDLFWYERNSNTYFFYINNVCVAAVKADGLHVDHVVEGVAGHGVEVDGVLCKDDAVETDAIRGLRETSGPTSLAMGAVADNEYLKRSGTTIVGAAGGGGVTDHGELSGLGDDDHPQYQQESEKNAASGYAGLDASTKLTGSQQVYGTATNTACVGNDSRLSDARTPTVHATSHKNGGGDEVATATPAANVIPKTGAGGKLDTWISDAAAAVKGLVQLAGELGGSAASPTVAATHSGSAHHAAASIGADAEHSLAGQVLSGVDAAAAQKGHLQLAGQLGGTAASPDVRGLRTTTGPTLLTMGAVADGQVLQRSGSNIVGAAAGGGVDIVTIWAFGG